MIKTSDADVLRWLIKLGCPWDSGVAVELATTGQVGMLKWALANKKEVWI